MSRSADIDMVSLSIYIDPEHRKECSAIYIRQPASLARRKLARGANECHGFVLVLLLKIVGKCTRFVTDGARTR